MPELIENGYLYIAQPPLYRIKKGKSENYLHDEKAFDAFVIHAGADKATLSGTDGERELSGQELEQYLRKLGEMRRKLADLTHDDSSRAVISSMAAAKAKANISFSDKTAIEVFIDAAKARLEVEYPHVKIVSVDYEVSENEEDSSEEDGEAPEIRYEAELTLEQNRERFYMRFGPGLLQTEEFASLQTVLSQTDSLGKSPFTLSFEGKAESLQLKNLFEVYDKVMERGRSGLSITRFKGLGEMNPEQLWETTLDPEHRSMLQVRIDDVVEADSLFTLLMGDTVEPRREFIEENALRVRNLDV